MARVTGGVVRAAGLGSWGRGQGCGTQGLWGVARVTGGVVRAVGLGLGAWSGRWDSEAGGVAGGRRGASRCARRAWIVAPAGNGSAAGAAAVPVPEAGAGPGMAVPFVEDWDLVQTLGEGAYGE